MKICAWNYRSLGGPFTISQLKESIRFHFPDIVFLSETKKKKSFISTVCKKLRFQNRRVCVDPKGLSGGLLACWTENVLIYNVLTTQFCIELECSRSHGKENFWVIFVYASTDAQVRQQQWNYLDNARPKWGVEWFLRGDFNDIWN